MTFLDAHTAAVAQQHSNWANLIALNVFLFLAIFANSHVAHLGTPLVSKPNSPQVRVALCLMAPAGWTSGPMPEKSALRPWDRAESQLLAYTRRDAPFGAHSGPTALHRPLSSVAASSLQVPKQTWPSRAPTNVSIQPNMSSHAPCRLCRASQPPRAWTLARVTHG